jgi:hypothetical protein
MASRLVEASPIEPAARRFINLKIILLPDVSNSYTPEWGGEKIH